VSANCYLVAGGNHSFLDVSTPIMFQPSLSKGGIRIGEDVWLGAGAIVLDGVTIGKSSVVGAGSVVTGPLPEYSFARGARGRFEAEFLPGLSIRQGLGVEKEAEPAPGLRPGVRQYQSQKSAFSWFFD